MLTRSLSLAIQSRAHLGSLLKQKTPPEITLPTQTDIFAVSAMVGATLDCKGLSTVWSIEYGLTDSYGSTQAGGTTSINGAKTVGLTGLPQVSTIHWRFKAVNSDGTVYSLDQTLNTIFKVATANGSKALTIKFKALIGKSIIAYWGDGTSNTYNGNGAGTDVTMTKTYSGAGTYPISFGGNFLDLLSLDIQSNNLVGDVSGWSVLTSLANMICYGNTITFASSAAWTGHNHTTSLKQNSLPSAQVDNAVIAFSGGSFASKTLSFDGTNQARTSASNAAVAILTGNGNTLIFTP